MDGRNAGFGPLLDALMNTAWGLHITIIRQTVLPETSADMFRFSCPPLRCGTECKVRRAASHPFNITNHLPIARVADVYIIICFGTNGLSHRVFFESGSWTNHRSWQGFRPSLTIIRILSMR